MEAKDVMIMKLLATILFFFLFLTGAFAQTRNVLVNTSSVVVQPTNFWSADASNARTGLGLGSAATNPSTAFQPSSSVLSNIASSNAINLTNIRATNIVGTVALASNVSVTLAISNGGTGATNAATARTNLSLGASWLTNTNVTNFRSSIDLGWSKLTNSSAQNFFQSILDTSDESAYPRIPATQLMAAGSSYGGIDPSNYPTTLALKYVSTPDDGYGGIPPDNDTWTIASPSAFRTALGISLPALTNVNNSNFRSSIGLGWPPLTNTNASNFQSALYGSNTNPVLVNSSGSVVSPTNFWQQAPIQTLVQTFIPAGTTNSYATNARNLYVYSMATSISGVTNTIILPTNSATFDGDAATITHKGTTSSITAVRQDGSATNFTTISNEDESVKFIREDGQWTFYHNISYVEPIRFTDGNIEANKAASRTNLGLGFAALTNTNAAGFQRAIFSTNSVPSNSANINTINFNTAVAWMEVSVITNGATNSYRIPLFQ